MTQKHLRDVQSQIGALQPFEEILGRTVKARKRAGRQRSPAGAIYTLIERTMETKPRVEWADESTPAKKFLNPAAGKGFIE